MSSISFMRSTRARRTTATVAAAACVALAVPAAGSTATATTGDAPLRQGSASADLRVIGLTPNARLVRFRVAHPDKPSLIGKVTGLTGDTRLIGIDFRVQDGRLYGVGDLGGVYTIGLRSAEAEKASQLTVPLEGTFFGVDFNPAADRLRVVSDLGQNLRHDVNPNGTTTVDGLLSYTPPAPATGITMAAYTNNDLSAETGTTLFDIDSTLDQVAIQAPANNGSLSATGLLGQDAAPAGGFDIYSTLDGDGVTSSVVGLASIKADGQPRAIYRINLLTGRARELGSQKANTPLVDLAVPLGQL